jgi:hypothetical protein
MRTTRPRARVAVLAVVLLLTGCGTIVAGPDDPQQYPQGNATSADYRAMVDDAEEVLAAAGEFISEPAIIKIEPTVTDLENDFHRMSCSDTTSQYTNVVNYYLADGTDEIAIIDNIRDVYVGEGWERADSLEEELGEDEDPEGSYDQILRSPDDFGLTVSRGDDGQGGTILQMTVFSPCIGNPTDKPASWGRL